MVLYNKQSIHCIKCGFIEADPLSYHYMKLNRPNAITINGALCETPKLLHLSSRAIAPVRGFVEFMAPSFLKQWHKDKDMDDLPTVQCLPIRTILKSLGVNHVDIWILDVEGAEEAALKVHFFL